MSIAREPCFWLTTSENGRVERERVVMRDGRRVVEKLPQHGHEGDYESKRRARGLRWVPVVRTEGHVVAMLLTCAAAHLDPSTSFGNYMRRKARHLGWYAAGGCPCAQHAAGELPSDCVVSAEVRTGKPCASGTYSMANPCKHDLAERAARRELWAKEHAERLAGFRSDAERTLEETRKLNKEMVVDVASIIAEQMAAQATAFAPSSTKKGTPS